LNSGHDTVNVGSPDMIHQLGQRAPGRNITLRINPGFGHGHSQKTNTGGEQSKHGIWHEQLDDCLLRADRHGLVVTGIHMHIGSGYRLGASWPRSARALEKESHGQVGRSDDHASVPAAGCPTPYRATDDQLVDLDQYFQLWDQTCGGGWRSDFGHPMHRWRSNRGRYLVAESRVSGHRNPRASSELEHNIVLPGRRRFQ
jgi:diaminopimelate decarboxylase